MGFLSTHKTKLRHGRLLFSLCTMPFFVVRYSSQTKLTKREIEIEGPTELLGTLESLALHEGKGFLYGTALVAGQKIALRGSLSDQLPISLTTILGHIEISGFSFVSMSSHMASQRTHEEIYVFQKSPPMKITVEVGVKLIKFAIGPIIAKEEYIPQSPPRQEVPTVKQVRTSQSFF